MIRNIPNFITCCNLLCGSIGIIYLFNKGTLPIAFFVWTAALFDFFDGFLARLLKVQSPIGKDLDSLADMVSFGLLPGLFMYVTLQQHSNNSYLPLVSLTIVAASAIRLAVFNNDTAQSDSFKGLPTPANALFLTGLAFLPLQILENPYLLCAICLACSALMVSRMELFALKFKSFGWKGNEVRFTFLALAVLLIIISKLASIPLIIIAYILISGGVNAFKKR